MKHETASRENRFHEGHHRSPLSKSGSSTHLSLHDRNYRNDRSENSERCFRNEPEDFEMIG